MRAPNPHGNGPSNRGELNRLLRFSHIFSSAVREVLETKVVERVTPDSLTVSQLHVLKVISLNGTQKVGNLAGFLGVSAPAATKNIDKLERLGLVERQRSSGDRRSTRVACTRKGRKVVADYESLQWSRVEPVADRFTHEELVRFNELLERFSLLLIERGSDHGGLCLRCAAHYDKSCAVGTARGHCPYQKAIGERSSTARPARKH